MFLVLFLKEGGRERNHKQLKTLPLVLGGGRVAKLEKENNSAEYLNNWIHDPDLFLDGGFHDHGLHAYLHTNEWERCYRDRKLPRDESPKFAKGENKYHGHLSYRKRDLPLRFQTGFKTRRRGESPVRIPWCLQ